jgi:hypothetical protein
VSVTFAPLTVGTKEVVLRVGDAQAGISGTAFDATITTFPWAEDFSGLSNGELPFGWDTDGDNWYAFNSNYAGGTAPELVFWWQPVIQGRTYVRTPPIRTTGLDSMNVSFRHFVGNFGDPGIYTLRLVTVVDEQEYTVLEWQDPALVPAEEISVQIYRDEHGVGADRLHLAWVFDGASDNLTRWTIDDIVVGAEPTLVISETEVDFGLHAMNSVSDDVHLVVTNIGGGALEISPDDIRIIGDDADQFVLTNIDETVMLTNVDTLRIAVAFAPTDGGEKHAELAILTERVRLSGRVFEATSHIERYIDLNLMRGGSSDDSEFNRVANPAPDEVNSSEEVVEFRRSRHGVPWGGFFAFLPVPLDLTENKYVYVDVWKPRISPIRFKVEDGPTADLEIESMNPQTVTEQWETMVFDFSEKSGEWNIIAFMPDFVQPVGLDEDIVIYFANIRLGGEPDFVTRAEDGAEIPRVFGLSQNYPNPFNPTTNIHYQVPHRAHVSIEVYDIVGRLVTTLVNESREPGYHVATFDGSVLASGVYLYRMHAGEFVQTMKLMLVK